MSDIRAMPDVVWPAGQAEALRTRANALADLVESQLATRRSDGTRACEDWLGVFRDLFDTVQATNLGNGAELVTNLRAMASALERAGSWVTDENAARARAREREHDDSTWGGLKKFYNSVVGADS